MATSKNSTAEQPKDVTHPARRFVVQALSSVEDVVYVGLGVLLAIAAVTLLLAAFKSFAMALWAHSLSGQVVSLLDQILLILLIVELLYTVQVSFREHGLIAEPFVVVALIAAIRRVLIITAEVSKLPEAGGTVFRQTIIELALLTAMVLVFVGSLIMLQKQTQRRRETV
jgi:uncharacterized membrane protein (DUF373 family)